jgi:HEPN domain-containing protein
MHANDRTIAVVREWVTKAENDLENAAHTVKMEKGCPTDTVGFHAQQAAEKSIKAVLIHEGVPFPRVHSIERLIDLLPPADAEKRCKDIVRRLRWKGPVYRISGVTHQGTQHLCFDIMRRLEEIRLAGIELPDAN